LRRKKTRRRHIREIQQEMIGLLQRVTHAEVAVSGKTIGQIGRGLMVLVAVHRDDTEKDVARLAERLLGYRVFADDHEP
jgi:D-tyrosyl-tRNA(Tyr) deacylase